MWRIIFLISKDGAERPAVRAAAKLIDDAVDGFVGNGNGVDRQLASDVRQVRRPTERVSRRLNKRLQPDGP